MVELNSNSSNVHRVVNDNNNIYRSMIINPMGMNQGYVNECLIINEESNTGATRFFKSF